MKKASTDDAAEEDRPSPPAPDGSRPPLSRAEAWREAGLAVAVLWAVLGGACFVTGAQWVYDSWGTSLNAALIIDVIFLAGVLVVIGFVWWRQRLHGEGLRELGWGRPTRGAAVAVAVVYGLAWVALSYARGGNPLAWSWQRPIMMGVGLILAFGEEIAVRGLILDRLERCGTGRLVQIVTTGAVMGVYHGVVGHHVWPSYMISSFVLFGLLSALLHVRQEELDPAAHRARHDPLPGRPGPHAGHPLRRRLRGVRSAPADDGGARVPARGRAHAAIE